MGKVTPCCSFILRAMVRTMVHGDRSFGTGVNQRSLRFIHPAGNHG
uniref:Uncharacterized protein n=1 Tax=Paenibacillus polymyxa TaxID=1406 RepID=A0AAE9PT65_PAEPO